MRKIKNIKPQKKYNCTATWVASCTKPVESHFISPHIGILPTVKDDWVTNPFGMYVLKEQLQESEDRQQKKDQVL